MVMLNPNLENISKELPQSKSLDNETIIAAPKPPKPVNNKHNHTIRPGQTLAGILQNYGVSKDETAAATAALQKHFPLNEMRAGDIVYIELFDDKSGEHIKEINFKPSLTKTVNLTIDKKGGFEVKSEEIKLQKVILKATGEISGSFYESTLHAGVTPAVITQLISALSYDVDFQRDIQPGNKFAILYEGYTGPDGEFIKSSRPLYVRLQMKKATAELFIVAKADGTLGYFHADAANAKKALLRTPIDGAKITSSFGMRFHPILGYTRMHKGVDFGAPQGTPIFAAGDGTIQEAGWVSGYGNFVLLKHDGTFYSTAYGHASRFGPGIKPGVHVKQGQIIAYVGMTGHATGPHLHYEVRDHGTQINPVSAKLPMVSKLAGAELKKFLDLKKSITTALSNAPTRNDLAQLIEDEVKDGSNDGAAGEERDEDENVETLPATQEKVAEKKPSAKPAATKPATKPQKKGKSV